MFAWLSCPMPSSSSMNGEAVVAGLGIPERTTVSPSPISLPMPKPAPAARMTAAAITEILKRLFRQASGTAGPGFASSLVPASPSAGVRGPLSAAS
jgi:hypothetical protein